MQTDEIHPTAAGQRLLALLAASAILQAAEAPIGESVVNASAASCVRDVRYYDSRARDEASWGVRCEKIFIWGACRGIRGNRFLNQSDTSQSKIRGKIIPESRTLRYLRQVHLLVLVTHQHHEYAHRDSCSRRHGCDRLPCYHIDGLVSWGQVPSRCS